MKRFIIVFVTHYCGTVLLFFFVLWFVPDRFPGDQPLTGVNMVLSRIAVPTAAVTAVLIFPSLFLADLLTSAVSSLAPYQVFLLTLPLSSVMWSGIFIVLQRFWISRRKVEHVA